MSNTETQKIAEEKAKAIINSCKTPNHFDVAKTYIEVFSKKFKDTEASIRLLNYWQQSLN